MESAELLLPTDADTSPPAPFFIPASASLEDGRPRTLKHADSFAVFDQYGDIVAGPGRPEGLYHRDTRYLSQLSVTLAGMQPILLSSTLRDDNATLTSDLTNPAVRGADGQVVLRHDLIHLRRTCFLWKANCFQRVCVRNFSLVPQHVSLELSFAADFADLFEVRGTPRARRGRLHHPQVAERQVLIAYTGLDRVRRETLLRFDPAPAELTAGRAIFDFTLAPRQAHVFYVQVSCSGTPAHVPTRRSFFTALRDARRSLRASSSRAVMVSSSNEIFNEAARRSLSDLYMLITDTPEGPYPYAGIPWYSTVFGRDALITALETLWLDPAIARGVLRYLAANQATMVDAAADAEPGKILHEVRHGEMALLGEVPFRRYYGSIDATPLFVMLAGAYLDRTGDIETVRQLQPNIEAALQWIDRYGDRDGDGFVEYGRRTDSGLANQGWKDSDDSVFHADGHLANGPIALAEVQAYVYGAWRAAAAIARRLGEAARAQTLEHRALDLQARFDERFFDDTLGS